MENNVRYFQWIGGDRRGEVVIFDKIVSDDGEIYITFKDGSRVNEKFVAQINQTNLSGKFVAEVDSPSNIWQFKETYSEEKIRYEKDANTGADYEIPPVDEIVHADLTSDGGTTRPTPQSKLKRIQLIPPKPTPPSHSVFGKIQRSFETSTPTTISEVKSEEIDKSTLDSSDSDINKQKLSQQLKSIDESDPIYILMSKAKKINTDINMEMTVALPSKSLYNIAKDSFDSGDNKFVDYIVDEITVDEIKEALKVAILGMYEDEKQSPSLSS